MKLINRNDVLALIQERQESWEELNRTPIVNPRDSKVDRVSHFARLIELMYLREQIEQMEVIERDE